MNLKTDPCHFRRNKPPENWDLGALRCASSWDWCREQADFKVVGQGFCSTELTARLSWAESREGPGRKRVRGRNWALKGEQVFLMG